MHCLYWKMFHSLNWTMQSVLQNLFCRIISGKEFHTVTSRGTDKVRWYSLAMATASAEGDALLARTGIPARIALIAISVGIRPLE